MVLDARKTVWVRDDQYREIKGRAALADMTIWDYLYYCYQQRRGDQQERLKRKQQGRKSRR